MCIFIYILKKSAYSIIVVYRPFDTKIVNFLKFVK